MVTDGAGPLRVAAIIGSTRKGRLGDAVGRWFVAQAGRRDDIELHIVDLVDFEFPARYPDRATPQMTEFATRIDRAEGFVVVTPEYNRSFPASLKQAIDYAYDEWRAKPVGFVSYGFRSAGLYAVEHLRTVFADLHTVTMRDSVGLDLHNGDFDDQGRPRDAEDLARVAMTMLDQLTWWGFALRAARTARPYVS